jgi:hypothetical protein
VRIPLQPAALLPSHVTNGAADEWAASGMQRPVSAAQLRTRESSEGLRRSIETIRNKSLTRSQFGGSLGRMVREAQKLQHSVSARRVASDRALATLRHTGTLKLTADSELMLSRKEELSATVQDAAPIDLARLDWTVATRQSDREERITKQRTLELASPDIGKPEGKLLFTATSWAEHSVKSPQKLRPASVRNPHPARPFTPLPVERKEEVQAGEEPLVVRSQGTCVPGAGSFRRGLLSLPKGLGAEEEGDAAASHTYADAGFAVRLNSRPSTSLRLRKAGVLPLLN